MTPVIIKTCRINSFVIITAVALSVTGDRMKIFCRKSAWRLLTIAQHMSSAHCPPSTPYTPTGTLCTAAAISLISEASFSMALPTTITSAPALQLR
jgi:hypothetical protein